MLYNFLKIKYELGKSSFKVFNNIVGKHKYYYTKKKEYYMQFLIYIIMILNEIVKSAHCAGHHLIVDNIQLTQNLTCVLRS